MWAVSMRKVQRVSEYVQPSGDASVLLFAQTPRFTYCCLPLTPLC